MPDGIVPGGSAIIGGRMHTLPVSPHRIRQLEWIAEGGFAIAVAVLSVITLATLIYAWFLA